MIPWGCKYSNGSQNIGSLHKKNLEPFLVIPDHGIVGTVSPHGKLGSTSRGRITRSVKATAKAKLKAKVKAKARAEAKAKLKAKAKAKAKLKAKLKAKAKAVAFAWRCAAARFSHPGGAAQAQVEIKNK